MDMYRFYLAAVDLLPAALLMIPVFWIMNQLYFHNWKKSMFYCLISCYLGVVYVLVGLPTVTYIRPELNLNLIPIIPMADDLKNSVNFALNKSGFKERSLDEVRQFVGNGIEILMRKSVPQNISEMIVSIILAALTLVTLKIR